MSILHYSTSELQPRKLSPGETADPYLVVHDLFGYAHLPQLRELLWEWLKTTVSGNWHQQEEAERLQLMEFYEKMERLIEAVHILHARHRAAADQS